MWKTISLVVVGVVSTVGAAGIKKDNIQYDVAIVGGGASGSYAAYRLKEEGRNIVLIDQDDHLGGHVDTYIVPQTNMPVDYGVRIFPNSTSSRQFFEKLGIELQNVGISPKQYRDFTTGRSLNPTFSQADQEDALRRYQEITSQYDSSILPGFEGLSANIPEDLTMSFRDFVDKHNLEAMVPMAHFFNLDDILEKPTLNVIQQFGPEHVRGVLDDGFFVPRSHDNRDLYAKIQEYLGSDALRLSSRVVTAKRSTAGVELNVEGPNGDKILVQAKRLLITIPPTTDNMAPFDLDDRESSIFSRWIWRNVYAGVLRSDVLSKIIPEGVELMNASPIKADFNLPRNPFDSLFGSVGMEGLYRTIVMGDSDFSENDARALVANSLRALTQSNMEDVDFVAFTSHSPMMLRPSIEDLKNGFYRNLFDLQGLRNTYYSGLAWTSDTSGILWDFTEAYVLPRLMRGM